MYKGYPTEVKSSAGQRITRPYSQQKEYIDMKSSLKQQSQSCEKSNQSTILKGKVSNKQQVKNKMKPTQTRFQFQQPQSLQTTHRYNDSPYVKPHQQQQLFELQKTIMADSNRVGNIVNQMKFHSQTKKNPQQPQRQHKSNQTNCQEKQSQSLNGSFELKKRIFTTNQDVTSKLNMITKSNRAQSVMDEYKTTAIELQQTMKIPEPILPQRIIPYDSETEFEGYRKGDFLTFESEDESENEDFLRKAGIEHFLKNLTDKEILLLEKYIYLRKYDMMARNPKTSKRNEQFLNNNNTSRTSQQYQQQFCKISRQTKK
ncbi:unnamed protein product [Paramecium primaurelia]|uniref:Uncharacterized protein n=1 Tax=Paramecium primaurelia TaxID=5886 RepID=A0A8S1KEW2_PARPR|nr:unnamed protein product [Paramecium primaurelia]